MSDAFAKIAFTESVRAAQTQRGSRDRNRRLEDSEIGDAVLGAEEIQFIAERDSFFMATVNQDGWPYVQHRGGPAGFLHVLDERTLGFADFRGNRQYVSVGNLAANDRVALIVVDYAARARLKIFGRARVVTGAELEALLAQLRNPDYPARIEQAILIEVCAFDWNCPQHIVPRYTVEEIQPAVEKLQARVRELEAQLLEMQAA